MDRSTTGLPPFTGVYTGPSNLFGSAMRWQVRLFQEGIFPHTVDCAIRYRLHSLMDEAIRLSIPPEELLQSITVQRAFTPYQILDVMRSIRTGKDPIYENRPIFLLAPAKQFFDGDVQKEEAEYLLRLLIREIQLNRRAGKTILIFEKESYPDPLFAGFMNQLLRTSDLHRRIPGDNPGAAMLQMLTSIQKPNLTPLQAGETNHGKNPTSILHANRPDRRSIRPLQKGTA